MNYYDQNKDPEVIAVLTDSNVEHVQRMDIGDVKHVCTSGVIDGGTLRLQQKNRAADAWADNPNLTFEADTHIVGVLVVVALYNRVFLDTPGASADVSLTL